MPWNMPSSAKGSRAGSISLQHPRGRGPSSSIGGFPTPVGFGGGSSLPSKQPSLPGSLQHQRAARRLTSASPLVGRGGSEPHRLPSFGDDEEGGFAEGIRSRDESQALRAADEDNDDFQLYGPAAAVDTQTAAQSQWMRAALNQESTNFLDFVRAEISTRMAASAEEQGVEVSELAEDDEGKMVTFEGLLPPGEHSKIVAAQAFHHVLTLASKGLVLVKQEGDEEFGEIEMRLVGEV